MGFDSNVLWFYSDQSRPMGGDWHKAEALSASLALLPSGRVGSGLRYNRISELRAHILDSSEWEITRWLVLRKSGDQFSFLVLCNRLPKTFSRSTTLT